MIPLTISPAIGKEKGAVLVRQDLAKDEDLRSDVSDSIGFSKSATLASIFGNYPD